MATANASTSADADASSAAPAAATNPAPLPPPPPGPPSPPSTSSAPSSALAASTAAATASSSSSSTSTDASPGLTREPAPEPATAAGSSSLHPPGTFSSSPVGPVVASNHHRRWRSELGWIKPGGEPRRRGDRPPSPGGGPRSRGRAVTLQRSRSPSHARSKSDTSEEDIRAPRGAEQTALAGGNHAERRPVPPSSPRYQPELEALRDREVSQRRSRSPEDERRALQDANNASAYVDGVRTLAPEERDVRILFKGREVFADDLIGLRVAKTFAGHGRFLGQVVKFDGSASLYTVVYADGDAEELDIESTIQILIQDEIERVDPSLPPPANSLFFKREGPPVNGAESPSSGGAATTAPHHHRQRSQSGGAERRSVIRISEREAQFVIGLFENHALPILLQQGWRVQGNVAGGEARYVAPGVGDGFSGSGAVFRSALDVVEYIASDNELLTACFPTNVHSAILSLLPDSNIRQSAETSAALGNSGVRKRNTNEMPVADGFTNKRHRQPRDEMYGGAGDARRMMATAGSSPLVQAPMGHVYRPAELEFRTREREVALRQGIPAERFAVPDAARSAQPVPNAHQAYYSSAEYRGGHSRHTSDASASSSRWSEPPVAPVSDKPTYHRRYEESPRWREREAPARGGYYALDVPAAEAVPRGYSRAERHYGSERTLMRPGFRASRAEPPPDYRYQGQEDLPTDGYRHRYADAPPHRFTDSRQVDGVVGASASRLPRDSTIASASSSRMRREGPAISMMDVDRLPISRGVSREEQPASHSPRGGADVASTAYGTFRGHYANQRSGRSLYGSEARGSTDVDMSSDAAVPQDEERAV